MRNWGNRVLFALQFFTAIPIRARLSVEKEDCPWVLAVSPLPGLVVGLVLALLGLALPPLFGILPAAALLVGANLLLTGGLHVDGLADTFDGLGSRKDAEAALEVMRDSRMGAFGGMALALDLLLRAALYATLLQAAPAYRTALLVLAPALGRCGMAVMAASASCARRDGMGLAFIEETNWRQVALAFLLALTVGLPALGLRGLGWSLAVYLLGFVLARWMARRLGGVTGDTLGMANEWCELAVLLLGMMGGR